MTSGRRAGVRHLTLAALVAVALSGGLLSGCTSSTNSVDAYCRTFYQQGTQFRNQFSSNGSSSGSLDGFISLLTAPSQLATFFGNLAAVAPASIQPQVTQIQQAFQQEVNDVGQDISDPAAGLLSGLASAVETGPAWNAVNNWTEANCGPPPGTKWLTGSNN